MNQIKFDNKYGHYNLKFVFHTTCLNVNLSKKYINMINES
jgi:hypothetical protein